MKTFASIAAISLSALLATGCATDGNRYSKTVEPAQPGKVVVNGRYVDVVERMARQRGTRVVWVNKPTRRIESAVAAQ